MKRIIVYNVSCSFGKWSSWFRFSQHAYLLVTTNLLFCDLWCEVEWYPPFMLSLVPRLREWPSTPSRIPWSLVLCVLQKRCRSEVRAFPRQPACTRSRPKNHDQRPTEVAHVHNAFHQGGQEGSVRSNPGCEGLPRFLQGSLSKTNFSETLTLVCTRSMLHWNIYIYMDSPD